MPAVQIRLFPAPKPLVDKLGKEFFHSLPEHPGVYFFRDSQSRLLYVGQSANLKKRLCSYRVASPERLSRKTIRMLHQVDTISWEQARTPLDAQLRENELLRSLRPKFNRANTCPASGAFVFLQHSPEALKLSVGREAIPGARMFGAFSSAVLTVFGSLTRVLWCLLQPALTLDAIPRALLLAKPRREMDLTAAESSQITQADEWAEKFLSGENSELLDCLQNKLEDSQLPSFLKSLLTEDAGRLEHFFRIGPQRLYAHSKATGETVIARDALPDLQVASRAKKLGNSGIRD